MRIHRPRTPSAGRSRRAVVIASVAVTLLAFSATANADSYEPNDQRSEAFGPIATSPANSVFSGAMDTENDVDQFFLNTRPGTNHIRVMATNTSGPSSDYYTSRDVYFDLLDEFGNTLSGGLRVDQGDPTGMVSASVPGPGKVYVQVQCASTTCDAGPTTYRFQVLDPGYPAEAWRPTPDATVDRPAPPLPATKCPAARRRLADTKRNLRKAQRQYARKHSAARRRRVSKAKRRYSAAKRSVGKHCR